jgi:hypothetical protein
MQSAHSRCLICGSPSLQPLLNLAAEGTPHGAAHHAFTSGYRLIVLCEVCGHGQLEIYSHDCFQHYEDEDWDMYWWYVLRSADVARLRDRLARCPDRLNAQCDCALHHSLRESASRLWGGVKHSVNPAGKISFAWLSLIELSDQVTWQVDREAGMGQAA